MRIILKKEFLKDLAKILSIFFEKRISLSEDIFFNFEFNKKSSVQFLDSLPFLFGMESLVELGILKKDFVLYSEELKTNLQIESKKLNLEESKMKNLDLFLENLFEGELVRFKEEELIRNFLKELKLEKEKEDKLLLSLEKEFSGIENSKLDFLKNILFFSLEKGMKKTTEIVLNFLGIIGELSVDMESLVLNFQYDISQFASLESDILKKTEESHREILREFVPLGLRISLNPTSTLEIFRRNFSSELVLTYFFEEEK